MKMKMNYYQEEEELVPNAWSWELPADILSLIADKLRSMYPTEYIKFGSVCLGWRSFSIENYQHIKLPNQLPVLLIPIPPSLLLLTDHKKNIPSLLSSSSSSDDEEDYEEEEEKGEEKKEEEEEEEVVVEEEKQKEIEEDKKEEVVVVEEEEKEEGDEEEEEEEDEEEEVKVKVRLENYYNPREIWEGQDAKQRHKNTRTFYSLSEKRVYHDFQLPVPYYKNIRGSSYGWLVTVQECYTDNGQLYLPVSLLNPFRTDNNNEIQLPPITNGNPGNLDTGERITHSYFLKKAFLSANPSSLSDPTTQLVVLGVYGHNRLAFCRPGDKVWTRLDLENYRPIRDIICYQDQFFAVLQSGYVFAFVFDTAQLLPTPIVTLAFLPPPDVRFSNFTYLVESGGDLLLVKRYVGCPTPAESERPTPVEGNGYITRKFLVFKLDTTEEWVEMKTLNDRMLFIGTSSSMSLSASDFPGWSRPNSIYYTDDHIEAFATGPQNGPHDMGIFNLETESFERHYKPESKTVMPPPIWIQPML